jgi:charged multivesicular body protein 2A
MTPAERLRKHQRALEKTQRELDRERQKLENQEKKLIADIKKSAKAGQMGACKIQAKDLVRTRRYVHRREGVRGKAPGLKTTGGWSEGNDDEG